ncbi:zinc-binding dehydrogenase [Streptomyces sp. AcE210]|nr:zinc-binding dehydrogenase [Streptomyces sp. AcE210]
MLPAVADGRIRPVMDSTLPYDRANTAAERLRTHQVHGKIILSMP